MSTVIQEKTLRLCIFNMVHYKSAVIYMKERDTDIPFMPINISQLFLDFLKPILLSYVNPFFGMEMIFFQKGV